MENKRHKEFFSKLIFECELNDQLIAPEIEKSCERWQEYNVGNDCMGDWLYECFFVDESPVRYSEVELKVLDDGETFVIKRSNDDELELFLTDKEQKELYNACEYYFKRGLETDHFKEEVERGEHNPKTI